jgi:hypothetical protein
VLRGSDPESIATETQPAGEPAPPTQPASTDEPTTASEPAAQQETCGPARVTFALGKAGLRASRIRVSGGGKKRLLLGPRRRLTIKVPYTGADRAQLTIRIRQRNGKLKTIKRTVRLCS